MKQILVAVALLTICLVPGVSQAANVFIDDFTGEARGVNKGSGLPGTTLFANWTVTGGTVDMIGYTGFFDLEPPGDQRYVDLDGTAGSVGTMVSSGTSGVFALLAATTYDLTFELAGSQRGDTNTMTFYGIDTNADATTIEFPGAFLSRDDNDPFSTATLTFTTGAAIAAARIVFVQDVGNNDNAGLLLDKVSLDSRATAIPEPASLMLLGAGLAGIGIWRRKAAKSGEGV